MALVEIPLIRTKYQMPLISESLIARPHLVQTLNRGLSGKMTLVSAPAGFGKTTLIISWLRSLNKPAAWVALDENDNDPVQFRGVDARLREHDRKYTTLESP